MSTLNIFFFIKPLTLISKYEILVPKINFDVRHCVCIPRSPQHTGSDGPEEKFFLPSSSLHLETLAEAERQTPVLSPAALAPLLRPHHAPLDLPGPPRHHHCLHKVIKHVRLVSKHFQISFRIHQHKEREAISFGIRQQRSRKTQRGIQDGTMVEVAILAGFSDQNQVVQKAMLNRM